MNSSKKALFKDYLIRKAELKDSQAVWEIRNDPVVRQSSLNSKKISLEDHEKWFRDNYFLNKLNFCFVLVKGENVMGYCRFDKTGEEFSTSIAILSKEQGKGLGAAFLGKALELLGAGKEILAQVKKDNPASLKIFLKNGFKKTKEEKGVISLGINI